MLEVAAHHDVGTGQRVLLAHSDVLVERRVGQGVGEEQWCRRFSRGLRIDHCDHCFVRNVDEFCAVGCCLDRFGQDHRYGFADETNLVDGQRGPSHRRAHRLEAQH